VGAGCRLLRHDSQPRVDHGQTHRPHGAPSGRANDAAETAGPPGVERVRAVRGYGWAPGERGAHDLPVPEHRRAHRRRIAGRRKDRIAGAGLAPEHGAPAAGVAGRASPRARPVASENRSIQREGVMPLPARVVMFLILLAGSMISCSTAPSTSAGRDELREQATAAMTEMIKGDATLDELTRKAYG